MEKLAWCRKQRGGIELVEPNENLQEAYLDKAENALRAVRTLADNAEWQICAAYYAMYFSVYALLMRIGIRSQIHSCTIELARTLLEEHLVQDDARHLASARKARIDAQYYTDKRIGKKQRQRLVERAPKLHLRCKAAANQLTEERVQHLRETLQKHL